jgi:hypothetical protein
MGIVNNVLAGSSGNQGYFLTNSLRFRGNASAFLNRTPASTTNRQIWTWSGWVKRGVSQAAIFSTNASDNSSYGYIGFDSDAFRIYQWNGGSYDFQFITTAVYRDPAAWYHFVIQVDTTQATAANRVRFYVNGVQVTAFSTNTTPSQNLNTYVNNSSYSHLIARNPAGSSTYFDGYLDEVNFIDGQALTPSSFGSFNSLTGVWQPRRYSGTYGTNGFYLPFTDNSALTTSSNVGLGRDFSGNGNYWTTNNISITAGANYDSMTDVPTLTSPTTANYCTLNPLKSYGSPLDANLAQYFPVSNWTTTTSTFYVSSGKWYWEAVFTNITGGTYGMLGIVDNNFAQQTLGNYPGVSATSYGYFNLNGYKYNNGSTAPYGASYADNDLIGVALDMDAGTLTFFKNGVSQGVAYSGLTGSFTPAMGTYGAVGVINFGQRPFSYTPPTGFNRLNTFNLPDSTIVAGNKQMDATTYTGTGATQSIVNAGGFAPDLVWVKSRSNAYYNQLYDTIRGVQKALYSNDTLAETTETTGLTAFNSNGFTVSTGVGVNQNATSLVGWQWKAGGTAVTNNAGTRTSQVSANTTAGFSVVTYTGNATGGATVGHGLGVAPSMMFIKDRSITQNWVVYHRSLGNTNAMFLDLTNASTSNILYFNNTTPSSSVFTLGGGDGVNRNADNFVAYCWSEVAGFSRFGSYTGNGSADGPFVFTGFEPRFIMIKNTTGFNWQIIDTARAPTNQGTVVLFPNLSNAENSTATQYDILSNGFKIRTSDAGSNGNGNNIIYMAFAENPFKNSLAR